MKVYAIFFDPKKSSTEESVKLLCKKNLLGGVMASSLRVVHSEEGAFVVEERLQFKHLLLRLLFLPILLLRGRGITASLLEPSSLF